MNQIVDFWSQGQAIIKSRLLEMILSIYGAKARKSSNQDFHPGAANCHRGAWLPTRRSWLPPRPSQLLCTQWEQPKGHCDALRLWGLECQMGAWGSRLKLEVWHPTPPKQNHRENQKKPKVWQTCGWPSSPPQPLISEKYVFCLFFGFLEGFALGLVQVLYFFVFFCFLDGFALGLVQVL